LRLAFIPSKFRLGIEPEPFALEIDLRTQPWALCDITHTLATMGEEAAREYRKHERDKLENAAQALVNALRARTPKAPMCKSDAVAFLQEHGLKKRQARTLLEDGFNADLHPAVGLWVLRPILGVKGQPLGVFAVEHSPSPEDPPCEDPPCDVNECGGENNGLKSSSNNATKEQLILATGSTPYGQNTPPIKSSNGAISRKPDFGHGSTGPKLPPLLSRNYVL
jgi:hypothetical protein